jgi:hypothetical protein
MAEISVGDLIARLRLDSTEFTRGIQDAVRAAEWRHVDAMLLQGITPQRRQN